MVWVGFDGMIRVSDRMVGDGRGEGVIRVFDGWDGFSI